jgi:hypothetical protein
MDNDAYYENYHFRIVLMASIVSLGIYAAGAYIIYKIGWIWLLLYVAYVLWLEIRLLRKSCVNCFYYGKICAFGKGKICKLFFKPGDPQEFSRTQVTWFSMLPDLLVSAVPIVAGIVLLIIDFNWVILGLMLLVILLTSAGNGYIRGSLACKYCKQREIGCPAMQLFERNNVV